MKNFFETFVTAVLLVTVVFASVSLMTAQSELIAARETHGQLLQAVQESTAESIEDVYGLAVQLDASVRSIHKDWHVDITRLESSNSRDYYLVKLTYTIDVPLFGAVSAGKIEGYADTCN